jgi:hypothetical protein
MLTLALVLALAPAPAAPPHIEFDFSAVPLKPELKLGQWVRIGIEVVAADGDTYWDSIGFEGFHRREDLTEPLAERMAMLGVKAEVSADKNTVRVTGWTDKDGFPRAVVCGRLYTRNLPPGQLPVVRNPLPPPVVFDLRPLPADSGGAVKLAFEVAPAEGGEAVRETVTFERRGRRADLAATVAGRFAKAGLKAEAAGDTVRVSGWPGKDGAVRPAAGGKVTSKDVVPGQLPRVTGLPPVRPCVVFDFGPVPAAPGRAGALRVEVTTAKGGETFQGPVAFAAGATRADLAAGVWDTLIRAGFHAERDGDRVRVYGSVSDKGKLTPVTGGTVACDQLKPGEQPTVTNPKKDR